MRTEILLGLDLGLFVVLRRGEDKDRVKDRVRVRIREARSRIDRDADKDTKPTMRIKSDKDLNKSNVTTCSFG